MAMDCSEQIPGAVELSNWFGGFPSFHDAKVDFQINGNGTGWLKAFGFRMTNKIDESGYFILDKYFAATFFLENIKTVSVTDFLPGLAIIGDLKISKVADLFELDFTDTSYGFSGSVLTEKLHIKFEPDVRSP